MPMDELALLLAALGSQRHGPAFAADMGLLNSTHASAGPRSTHQRRYGLPGVVLMASTPLMNAVFDRVYDARSVEKQLASATFLAS